MSADSALAFFGVRRVIPEEEIELLEKRTHPVLLTARRHGLSHFWGNFGEPGERWLLFIGTNLGMIGAEWKFEIAINPDQLAETVSATGRRLREAGIDGAPALFFRWQPDA